LGSFASTKIIVDDEDNDDDTSEIAVGWLSFRIRPKINSLAFKINGYFSAAKSANWSKIKNWN
jgi:hypothetical protein